MTDAKIAVIGLGSVGSMALWQATQRSSSVVGLEARTPAHSRSAVGGDTRLFRMTYREPVSYGPLLEQARLLWRRLEEETGQEIVVRCGGLSIGTEDGPYLPKLLDRARRDGIAHEFLSHEELGARYPQHDLSAGECAIFDPHAAAVRTDRAVLSAVSAARERGADVLEGVEVDGIHERADSVVVTSGAHSWSFDRVIVAGGGWSKQLLPHAVADNVHTRRNYLTWFTARQPAEFTPDRFPVFIRIVGHKSMYGTPTLDGATVKATLDGRSTPAPGPADIARELTESEISESHETVRAFLPGLVPSIVRSDAYPDLYTADKAPVLGTLPTRPRTIIATGFSGLGFKMAPSFGARAAAAASGEPVDNPQFLDPGRFGPK
jgi:sarcosine oxidase